MLHQISQEYAGLRQFNTFEFNLGDGFTRIVEFESNPRWDSTLEQHVIEVTWSDDLDICGEVDHDDDWQVMTLRQAKAFLDKSQKLQDMFAG
jgi:hypothetical protein